MIGRILAVSFIALGLGLYAEGAHAGQTFMCDDGRMLQVEFADLERMKREEPCIAAHYGMTVAIVPLPVKRPVDFRPKAMRPGKALAFKGAQKAAQLDRGVGTMAQVSTDYRRVRIINARPGANAWYSHTR